MRRAQPHNDHRGSQVAPDLCPSFHAMYIDFITLDCYFWLHHPGRSSFDAASDMPNSEHTKVMPRLEAKQNKKKTKKKKKKKKSHANSAAISLSF